MNTLVRIYLLFIIIISATISAILTIPFKILFYREKDINIVANYFLFIFSSIIFVLLFPVKKIIDLFKFDIKKQSKLFEKKYKDNDKRTQKKYKEILNDFFLIGNNINIINGEKCFIKILLEKEQANKLTFTGRVLIFVLKLFIKDLSKNGRAIKTHRDCKT